MEKYIFLNDQSIIIPTNDSEDFTRIAFAASEKDLIIEEVASNELQQKTKELFDKGLGARAIKITFGDCNGTRQAFIESLDLQAEAE